MTTAYSVPLLIGTPQTLTIALGGVFYNLRIIWNGMNQAWTLDINDQNNVPILNGIPLVTGEDLLEPYAYLNFGGQLIAQTDHNASAPPTFNNLGDTGHLYFVTQ